jgi:site-specific DNA-methyltransferase (adenine-specific)
VQGEPLGQNMFPANVLLVEGIEETLDKYFLVPKPSVEERGTFNQHPAVMPLALCEYLIQLAAPAGAVVLDPFLGSGTTALAARNLKRRYIGIEINPEYVAIARQRLQNFTPSLFE